jgi:hypothetical protein
MRTFEENLGALSQSACGVLNLPLLALGLTPCHLYSFDHGACSGFDSDRFVASRMNTHVVPRSP